jgi:methylated-DNA-[protein]-cysteine S-methyltransferase
MSKTVFRAEISSPLGTLYCAADDSAVLEVLYEPRASDCRPRNGDNPILRRLHEELKSYFSGTLREFTVPVKLYGTPHRLKIWNTLKTVPYGETASYKDIAQRAGSVPIATGQAVGANCVNILIPCHRVVGSDGSLTGYGGGLGRKRFLLDLEGGNCTKFYGVSGNEA